MVSGPQFVLAGAPIASAVTLNLTVGILREPDGTTPLAALAGSGGVGATTNAATIIISNAIERSTFWTSNNVYELADIIYVRSNATLTVEQATTIPGWKDADTTRTNAAGSAANNPGTLIVTRGSEIRLLGTEANQIIMDAKSFDGSKDSRWGGLVLCGRAFVANGTAAGANPLREVQVEGVIGLGDNGKFGGGDDDDDSGVIRYVSIRRADEARPAFEKAHPVRTSQRGGWGADRPGTHIAMA